MIFTKRKWAVARVNGPEELAEKLVNYTWTLCTGFRLGEYIFLNDSTSENGAQEYAVLKSNGEQVESITFSWCSYDEALQYIREVVQSKYDCQAWNSGIDVQEQLQTPEGHGTCAYCA